MESARDGEYRRSSRILPVALCSRHRLAMKIGAGCHGIQAEAASLPRALDALHAYLV
jgi:hypothetical protein